MWSPTSRSSAGISVYLHVIFVPFSMEKQNSPRKLMSFTSMPATVRVSPECQKSRRKRFERQGRDVPCGPLETRRSKTPPQWPRCSRAEQSQAQLFFLHNNTSLIIPLYFTDVKHSKMFPFSMIENPVDIFTHRIYNNNSRVVFYETSDGSDSSVK